MLTLMLNKGRSPTQKNLQRTYSTQNKYLGQIIRISQDLAVFVMSKPTYYKYSLYESACNHILLAYPYERCTKHVPFTHMSI